MKKTQSMNKPLFSLMFLVLFISSLAIPAAYAQDSSTELPKSKQTTLGLYLTSQEAYEMWVHKPEEVKILDVRTLDEYIYIGHVPMAWNVVAFFQTTDWDEEKHHFSMKPNPDFINQIKELFDPEETILVTCRSGSRSAMVTNLMAAAGYKNVFNITESAWSLVGKTRGLPGPIL